MYYLIYLNNNNLNAVKIMIILNDYYFDSQEVVNDFLHQEIKLIGEKKTSRINQIVCLLDLHVY